MRLQPGSMFAGYTIERQLGAGGMGVVYLARHPRLERSVALKVLNDAFANDAKARARFEREAALITALDHPNIVPIYDRNSLDDEVLWISMKFIEGGDAASVLAHAGGRVTAERAVRMIGDAARALDHAHQYGVLHRDVKPANLLVEHGTGNFERTVVTDFGIARAVGDSETASRVSATLAYTAPERFGGGPVDFSADLYSLGCTLFKMLTGEPPYPRSDDAAVIAAHLHSPLPRLSDLRPELPSGLDAVLATVLAKRPEDRYPDCESFAAAAREAVDRSGETVAGRYLPDFSGDRTPGGPQRIWLGEDAETAASPMFTSGSRPGVNTPPPGPDAPPATGSPATPRRVLTRRQALFGGAAVVVGAAAAGAFALIARDTDHASESGPNQNSAAPAQLAVPSQILALAFSPNGSLLATGGKDNATTLWEMPSGRQNGNPLTGHTNSIRAVAFSTDGSILATGSEDSTARLWDVNTHQPLGGPLSAHTNALRAVAFHPNGTLLATASDDSTARLWNVQTRQPTATLSGHTGAVRGVAFSSAGRLVATGSADSTARLWTVSDGAQSGATLTGHNGQIRAVAFHPDGSLLATAGDDASIRLWDVMVRKLSGTPLGGHSEPVLAVAFNNDGTVLASGSRDGTVRLWDLTTREPIGNPLTGHTASVHTVAFSPDGALLATGSADSTVRLWKVAQYR